MNIKDTPIGASVPGIPSPVTLLASERNLLDSFSYLEREDAVEAWNLLESMISMFVEKGEANIIGYGHASFFRITFALQRRLFDIQ